MTASTTTHEPRDPGSIRYCMCHGEPVRWTHRRDVSGNWRVTHLCQRDLFDLGYGGGVRLEDLGEAA